MQSSFDRQFMHFWHPIHIWQTMICHGNIIMAILSIPNLD